VTFTIPRPEWVSDDLIADRGENAGFQMYTTEGNDAVGRMVQGVIEAAENLPALTRADVIDLLRDGVQQVRQAHEEIYDTEPEWAIVDAINAFFDTQGWVHIDRDDLSS
jgi:hypothetical protein